MPARYTIGIDLGTSNCALAYVDAEAPSPRTHLLEAPQYEALGKWREDAVLPSFCYFLTDDEARELHGKDAQGEGNIADWSRSRVVGLWAREMASLAPERVAYSAKSWLCHRGVDRESKLLPWQSTVLPAERKLSPVDVSAAYLSYLRTVWDQQMAAKDKTARFDRQDIVITVPASFDSDAQRLTLEAAERAGFPASTRLLEEPQAAFYAWLERHPGSEELAAAFPQLNERPELVLVCDIGGGTSDFSLFEVTAPKDAGDLPSIRRLAVSEHILLGGDNLDLALAKTMEARLTDGGELSTSAWAQLLSQCRSLKERVLAMSSPEREKKLPVSVTEGGSSLFASARSADITQGELLDLVLDGFFPDCPADAKPERELGGIREMGLPYAQDSAITRHLAGFLNGRRVDALLFNGGTVASSILRDRLCAQAAKWQDGASPNVLANDEPHLAVARGAAHYRYCEREAAGVTISGGSGHAIYLEIEGAAPKKLRGKKKKKAAAMLTGVCILPQGAEIESPQRLVEHDIQLLVDRPVRFQAWTSPSRPDDAVGEIVDLNDDAFHRLPALSTLAQLPPTVEKPADGKLAVHLISELNNLGLLQVVCESVRRVGDRQRRWALEFNLREKLSEGDAPQKSAGGEDTGVSTEDLQKAQAEIEKFFGLQSYSAEQSNPARLLKELEELLRLKRKEWNTALLRELWEPLGEALTKRDISVEHELAWLMAAGFSLRPGYGHAFDQYRMQRLWFVHELGLAHDRDKAIREQLFILWRRTAGGLDREQQLTLYRDWQEKIYEDTKQGYEPLRMAGALELLPVEERTKLARHCQALITGRAGKFCDHAIWALGRLLSRTPLYGGESAILPSELVSEVFAAIEPLAWRDSLAGLTTSFAQAARKLDSRDHDLPAGLRERVLAKLRDSGASAEQLRSVEEFIPLEEKDRQQLFGESLPVGLQW
ncbi:hsp70 family protein [Cerasicoccus maritimus]|uniref:hsp70 family protein n=1 Tax=Cerasicoccus maritimus TaxID=490089 RepID=UPI002852AC65|nr:Hsp70 family protein [Cerasicoccus maritimus]